MYKNHGPFKYVKKKIISLKKLFNIDNPDLQTAGRSGQEVKYIHSLRLCYLYSYV